MTEKWTLNLELFVLINTRNQFPLRAQTFYKSVQCHRSSKELSTLILQSNTKKSTHKNDYQGTKIHSQFSKKTERQQKTIVEK